MLKIIDSLNYFEIIKLLNSFNKYESVSSQVQMKILYKIFFNNWIDFSPIKCCLLPCQPQNIQILVWKFYLNFQKNNI